MSLVHDTLVWLGDKAHYRGADGIPHRLVEHLGITAGALGIACLIALPIAVGLGHTRRFTWLGAAVLSFANATRAVPTFAVLVLFAASPIGIGNRATIIALSLFAIPPLLTNAFVGVRGVDPDVVEAARGSGMSGAQVLRRVELPLALPLIAAGFRTAAVQVVATATLAAYVGGGGLGRLIADGFGRADPAQTAAGGVLVAALALMVEIALALVQRMITKGPREARVS
jgi:osmoprotectant transport system permease protein